METTPLHDLHVELGARMGPFAGYDMPIRYEAGTLDEHRHTRTHASLFDVSHMGVVEFPINAADELERLVPSSVTGIGEYRGRYTVLLNQAGGAVDDLIVTNRGDHYMAVLNASRKHDDIAHIEANGVSVHLRDDRAILALQGPEAVAVLAAIWPEVADLGFMGGVEAEPQVWVSRSGYTGEDGFEVVLPSERADSFARQLLSDDRVEPAGLGARDTLRLEAGLCLYGNDLDETTTPVEAGLRFIMQKRRREEGGFLGDDVILDQLANGPARHRVGLQPTGRAPVRDHAVLSADGDEVGVVTSGGFSPTTERPIAMGYVTTAHAEVGAALTAEQRSKQHDLVVADLPFVPHRYIRGVK